MEQRISFEQWIAYVFDHPVAKPAWYFSLDTDYWEGAPADVVAYLTRVFEEGDTVLSRFSDAQIGQGLYYLINNCCSSYSFALLDTAVPLQDRLRCIEAMGTTFERLFAPRCSPHLSHRQTKERADINPLNEVCYMWWDLLPLHGLIEHRPEHPDAEAIDRAILDVIRRISRLDSIACQESALFGLTWAGIYYPEAKMDVKQLTLRRATLRSAVGR